jgi:TolA-binding protein
MDELETLASELRQELGSPPEAWQAAQRARWRQGLRARARHSRFRALAPWVAASLSAMALVIWLVSSRRPGSGDERWLVAEELHGPVRLDDGSSISLEPGGRGRLSADPAKVHFDLHQGRASFDVVPGRKRAWTIRAGKNEVRVVGTRFSVFFGAGEAFDVEVERGIVTVQVPDRNASMELKAGDHLRGRPGQLEVTRGTASTLASAPARVAQAEDGPAAPAQAAVPEVQAPPAAPAVPEAATSRSEWQVRYAEGKYAESLALVRARGVGKHLTDLSPAALAELADAARLGGDPELAVRALTLLIQRFPGAPEARDGRFLLGRVHVLRGDDAAAVEAFESYLRSGPSGRYVNETRGRLMELYSKRGQTERARAVAQQYLEVTPNGPYHRLARSLLTPEP